MTAKSIQLKKWEDIPSPPLRTYLRNITLGIDKGAARLLLLKSILSKYYKLKNSDVASLMDMVDFSFLETAPLYPLIKSFRCGFVKYYFGEAKLRTSTGLEFQLIDQYYSEYIKTSDPKKLQCLVATMARRQAKKIDQIKFEDKRIQLISQSDVEARAEMFQKLPPEIYLTALMYAFSSLQFMQKTYGPILGGSTKKASRVNLGWTATFMSIAETRVFGDLNAVYHTNIHTLMAFLIQKKQEAADMELASSNKKRIL